MNGECKSIPISSLWTIDDSIPFAIGGWDEISQCSGNIPTSNAEIGQHVLLTNFICNILSQKLFLVTDPNKTR